MIELNKIYNEDCLEGMKCIPDGSVDCVICDLPYGVLNKQSEGGGWDNAIPFEPMWKEYLRITKPNAAIDGNTFEINEEYYKKACKRIKMEQAQLTLF